MAISNGAVDRIKRLFAVEPMKGLHGAVVDDLVDDRVGYMGLVKDYTTLSYDVRSKTQDYQAMSMVPEISTALDIYADNATQPDFKTGRALWAVCDDAGVQKVVDKLLEILEIEGHIWGQTRAVAQFGCHTVAPIWRDDRGIVLLRNCAPGTVNRVEDDLGQLLGYSEDGHDMFASQQKHSKPWHYIQFMQRAPVMALGDMSATGLEPYSILEPVRQTWKEYQMILDCILALRLKSAVDRFIIPLDVTGVATEDREEYRRRFQRSLKRKTFQSREELITRYRSMLMDEDIVVPVTSDKPFEVQRFEGKANISELADLDFWRRRLSGGLKVPQSYGGFEAEISTRASLAMQDIEFARSVRRLQRGMIVGWTNVINLHLVMRGFGGDEMSAKDLPEFVVKMTPPSTLEEQARAEYLTTVADLAARMWEIGNAMMLPPKKWSRYVLRCILGMPVELVNQMLMGTPTEPGGEEAGTGEEESPVTGMELPVSGEDLVLHKTGREIVDSINRETPGFAEAVETIRQCGTKVGASRMSGTKEVRDFVDILPSKNKFGKPSILRQIKE